MIYVATSNHVERQNPARGTMEERIAVGNPIKIVTVHLLSGLNGW